MTVHTDSASITTPEEEYRFAQALRGHAVLLNLLPISWAYRSPNTAGTRCSTSTGFWVDAKGNSVAREDVLNRLEERLSTLYSFWPKPAEIRFIHDELLAPLYSHDTLHSFLHAHFKPTVRGHVMLDDVWALWSAWKNRTAIDRSRLELQLSQRCTVGHGALLGWSANQ